MRLCLQEFDKKLGNWKSHWKLFRLLVAFQQSGNQLKLRTKPRNLSSETNTMRKGIGNLWQVQTPVRPHPESQKTSYQKQIRHDIRWNWNWKRTGTPSSIHTISMSEPNTVCDLSNNTTQSIEPGSQKIGFAQIESNRCSHRPRGASSHFQLCTFTAKPFHWPALEHKVPKGFQQVVCNICNICIFQFCTSIAKPDRWPPWGSTSAIQSF